MNARQARAWVAFFGALVLIGYALIQPAGPDGGSGPDGGVARDDDGAQDDGGVARDDDDRTSADDVSTGERRAVVLRVTDGDTVLVRILGAGDRPTRRTERVRYIGVDTPESVKPGTPVQCYGKEAAEFNRRLVDGRRVRLVPDREPRDRYGRTLAYVYVGDVFVNAELLRRGYARTLEIAPNDAHAERFADLERVAIRTSRGLWKVCGR